MTAAITDVLLVLAFPKPGLDSHNIPTGSKGLA